MRKTVHMRPDAAKPALASAADPLTAARGVAAGQASWHWGAMVHSLCPGDTSAPVASPGRSGRRMASMRQAQA